MRVIFSRKGFDSATGGGPSPLLSGRPCSLPIPTRMPTVTRYRDLHDDAARNVAALTRGRIRADDTCHLDPDLDPAALSRRPGWRGALGQVGAAQSHLHNQAVAVGDLFLFWGLFQSNTGAPDWRFTGPREHRVFGWLQVGEIWTVGNDPAPVLAAHPWLHAHPHAQAGNWSASNAIYIATNELALKGQSTDLPGWGLLRTGYRLTAPESDKPSVWTIPAWLDVSCDGTGLSYHPTERWLPGGRLQTAARGQEFVADIGARNDARDWVSALIRETL